MEVKNYEVVRDIREKLLQGLRMLEDEDLSLLLEVVGVVLLQDVVGVVLLQDVVAQAVAGYM